MNTDQESIVSIDRKSRLESMSTQLMLEGMQGNRAQLNRDVALQMLQPARFKHVAFLGTCEIASLKIRQENMIVVIEGSNGAPSSL